MCTKSYCPSTAIKQLEYIVISIDNSNSLSKTFCFCLHTQMVAVALGPWASHLEDRAEP